MAGNKLETKWGKIARTFSRNNNIEIRLSGTRCDTDMTGVINLPANSDDYKDADAQVLEGLLDHEWKHVEVQRKAEEQSIATPKDLVAKGDNKTNQLFNVYEDYRIERELAGEYIGCADNLRVSNKHVIKLAKKNINNFVSNPFKTVSLGILGRLMSIDIGWLPKESQAIVEQLKPIWNKGHDMKSHLDAWDLAEQTLAAMGELKDQTEQQKQEQQDQSQRQDGKQQNGEQGDQGNSEAESQDAGGDQNEADEGESGDSQDDSGQDEDGDNGAGQDGDATGEKGDDEGQGQGGKNGEKGNEQGQGQSHSNQGDSDQDKQNGNGNTPDSVDQASPGGSGDVGDPNVKEYLERVVEQPDSTVDSDLMDTAKNDIEDKSIKSAKHNKRHIPHPDAVAKDELTVAPKQSSHDYNIQLKEVKKIVNVLRTKLITVIRARSQRGFITERESGDIDVASLYRLRTGDKRVFSEPHKKFEIDTAVSVLIDHSGSMDGSKAYMAQQATIALTETLNHLGVSTEVIGFYNGCSQVGHGLTCHNSPYNRFRPFIYTVYKTFKESFHKVKTRMALMKCSGINCDGEAVWFMANRLASQPEQRKILIVLSDGKPNLTMQITDKPLLFKDLTEKVKRIEAAGIEVAAIGIVDNGVTRFYKDHVIIDKVEQLPTALFNILKRKLV